MWSNGNILDVIGTLVTTVLFGNGSKEKVEDAENITGIRKSVLTCQSRIYCTSIIKISPLIFITSSFSALDIVR